jgi:(2Fe-2S) ferredoxin
MPKFQKHIFICQNQRPVDHPRGSCDPNALGELPKLFKKSLAEHGIRGDVVRANKSGCLEQCEHGPTVVVYPDEVWYGGVQHEDVAEIVESHILNNQPVERLRIADECLNAEHCPHKPRKSS